MKFKILELEQRGEFLYIGVEHKSCCREVFCLPLGFAKSNDYIPEIKRILKEREKVKSVSIDKKQIGKVVEY